MTTSHSNRIITLAERNAMLGDGVSNAELRTLLAGVDKKGVPVIDRKRIGELIGQLNSPSEWPFGWIRTEEGFDKAQAIADLKDELVRREQDVAGNAEQVGRYVKALNQYSINSGHYIESRPFDNNLLRNYLNGVLSGGENPVSAKSETTPNLSKNDLNALTCEYAEQVAYMNVTVHQCPIQPKILSGHVYGVPEPGRML